LADNCQLRVDSFDESLVEAAGKLRDHRAMEVDA
jgi:hypothetical protein